MSDDSQHARFLKIVDKHIRELGEHFDNVQIFITTKDENGDGTVRICKGSGDWFSRYGVVNYWLQMENQEARNSASKHDED